MALLNLIIIAALSCVAVSIQLASCASDHATVQKPLKQYGNYAVHQDKLALHLLPRKLKLQEEASSAVKSLGDNGLMLQDKLMEASSSGKKENKKEENVVHGTWAEWVNYDGPKKSEYYTMDYTWVRRRRPIHNKQIPFLP